MMKSLNVTANASRDKPFILVFLRLSIVRRHNEDLYGRKVRRHIQCALIFLWRYNSRFFSVWTSLQDTVSKQPELCRRVTGKTGKIGFANFTINGLINRNYYR